MENLTAKHYLGIYTVRKAMQENGITNPRAEIKKFISEFVSRLTSYPLDEEILLTKGSFFDSKGNLIITIPSQKNDIP
jgi:hypothetical protein